MNKTIITAVTLIFAGLLFISCQKAKGPEGKKEIQVQQTAETKPLETKPEIQNMQKTQLPPTQDAKEEKKEKVAETKESPLTEEEQ